MVKSPRLRPNFDVEADLARRGFAAVAGIDEAGRGPLAGPVCAAAVILDPADLPVGIADSKILSAARREAAFPQILARARAIGIGLASSAEIDRIDIRQGGFLAMRRAAGALALPPDHLIVDGNDPPPWSACPVVTIVKGDSTALSIAAASIVAKVTRDRLMIRAHRLHPVYGFDRHKGYGTALHRAAILRHGPCVLHRARFLRNLCDVTSE